MSMYTVFGLSDDGCDKFEEPKGLSKLRTKLNRFVTPCQPTGFLVPRVVTFKMRIVSQMTPRSLLRDFDAVSDVPTVYRPTREQFLEAMAKLKRSHKSAKHKTRVKLECLVKAYKK